VTVKSFLPATPDLPGRLRSLIPGGTPAAPKLPKLPKVRRQDSGGLRLALTEVRGHLTYTAQTITAWYTIDPVVWPFRADPERESIILACAAQYATLGGRHLHLRRTTVPFPVRQWATALEANSRPLPDRLPAAGEQIVPLDQAYRTDRTWKGHVGNAARWITDGEYASGRTQLGVTLARRDQAAAAHVDELTESLAVFGLQARPSTPDEMAWLIYRSTAIGLTPPAYYPGDVGPDDVMEFTEHVDWTRSPFSTTTQLTDRRTGTSVHVAVLTVGRMERLEIPQVHQPWAHLSEQAGYPVDWSSRIVILDPEFARGPIERRMLVLRNQQNDYAEHGLPFPPNVERQARRAAEIGDELDTGQPAEASRAHGWHRMAVYGDSEAECLARVRDLSRLYAQQLHITLAHPRDQVALLHEFIPGEPDANTGHVRRMPVRTLAAAMPQATAKVGDDRGDLIGYTAAGGEHPVMFDPHFAMEVRERSGLTVLVSEPGGGKSTLMGALGYLNVRRGVRVTLMDPSGPLAALAQLPELAPYSRVLDLTGSQPGTLAPYAMVPDPSRADFSRGEPGDTEFKKAVSSARAERKLLVLDILKMLLPPEASEDIVMALHEALRCVPADEFATLDDVVRELVSMGAAGDVAAGRAAGLINDAADFPLGRLFFGSPPAGTVVGDVPLTIITMGGLRLPDMSTGREHWSVEERMALPMLHVAHRLAVRGAYAGDRHARKFVGLDEAHIMEGWPSGRAFLVRLARDSRKWNLAALVASQNPRDILKLDVQNLVTSTFVGRISEDREVAAEALRMLRIPTGDGYEATLAALSQYSPSTTERLRYREFVMRDVDGRVQKIRVDVSYVPGLLAALNTTPGAK
jgi:hypothetical protein